MYILWTILHNPGWIHINQYLSLKTAYPLLPWIGIILLGYVIGPWFTENTNTHERRSYLLIAGLATLAAFVVLCFLNIYQEGPWSIGQTRLETLMSFFNVTKHTPTLPFICLTLGMGLLLLYWFDHLHNHPWMQPLATFGAVPMFFYLLHIYVLKLLYFIALQIWGAQHDARFAFNSMAGVWICTLILSIVLFPAAYWFKNKKA